MGFNRGEWGGQLAWFTHDGKLRETLLEENVVAILPTADGAMVFAGLAHRLSDSGSATHIVESDGGFRVGRSTGLGSAAHAVVRESSGDFLVVTADGLSRVSPEMRAEQVAVARWGMMYPNSVAVDAAGTIYVGMRGVVSRIEPLAGGYRERWLVPPTK